MKNITSTDNIYNNCTGCGMCAAVCPANAISMKLSKWGFYEPVVSNEICIECGKCIRTCYKYDAQFRKKTIQEDRKLQVYSAQNRNIEELQSSSSGAVSIELMRYCIDSGYKVVGVAYDYANERAETRIACDYEELAQFKGSKYFQSYTEEAFKIIIKDNSTQKYAIFGTPCQIYAFSKYAEYVNKRDQFFFVDIFCHGCPSFILWEKYLNYTKQKYKVEKFDQIVFRSKSNYWHEFCFDFIKKGKKHTSSKYSDPFYELFFSNDILHKSCYDCIARGTVEKADIRLGDFWGARYDTDKNGVSAVVIVSSKGERMWEAIEDKFKCKQVLFDEVAQEQSYGTVYDVSEKQRREALDILISNSSMEEIIKKHRKIISNKDKIRKELKIILKLLPNSWYMKIKYIFHKIK